MTNLFNQLANQLKPTEKMVTINAHELAMRLAMLSVANLSMTSHQDEEFYVDNKDGSIGLTAEGQMVFDAEYLSYLDMINSYKI